MPSSTSTQMRNIVPPRPTSTDRFVECQQAIEGAIQEVIATAVEAGWGEPEVLAAVIEVTDNLALGLGADEEMAAILRSIRRETK